jgi:hypothetical protein
MSTISMADHALLSGRRSAALVTRCVSVWTRLPRLLRDVADGLDVVAVGVADEPAVVTGMVFRPVPRLVQDLGAGADRHLDERADRGPIRRSERDVRLAEPFAGRPRADPEVGCPSEAVADDVAEVEDSGAAKRSQDLVVERRAGRDVGTLDGQVIEHAGHLRAARRWGHPEYLTRAPPGGRAGTVTQRVMKPQCKDARPTTANTAPRPRRAAANRPGRDEPAGATATDLLDTDDHAPHSCEPAAA